MRNRVQLIGNLGNDPEVKKLETGTRMARFSIATNETYKNKKGEKITDTQWHRVVAFGPVVEVIEKYVKKGSEIAVEGKLKNSSYDDKDGNKRYSTDIQLDDLVLLGSRQ